MSKRTSSWQALYRALLRSSSASVRFSRPAARNTRRYLRDDFTAALSPTSLTKSGIGPKTARNDSAKHTSASNQDDNMRRLTSNTLAFHLSASLYSNVAQQNPELNAASGSGSPPIPPLCVGVTDQTRQRATISESDGTSSTPSKAAGCFAHRIISNLSNLTYHHLSPHTQMQSPQSSHLRASRAALRKPKKLSSLARVLGKLDSPIPGEEPDLYTALQEGEGEEGAILNLAHMKLPFLLPSPKPIRGPKEARLRVWDGQGPEKVASEGMLRQMQEDLDTVERLLEESGKRGGGGGGGGAGKQVQQLREEADGLRKKTKAAGKALMQAEEKRKLEDVGVKHLAELIAAAQDREGLMLGKERWMRRARGEYLPP
ncbi:uncharacterized protein UDID_04082 [Ustilago sp. UG-2017a]|nr:uncharacterized protein UDID_04082 [Ustilago sp. UG-2017a]